MSQTSHQNPILSNPLEHTPGQKDDMFSLQIRAEVLRRSGWRLLGQGYFWPLLLSFLTCWSMLHLTTWMTWESVERFWKGWVKFHITIFNRNCQGNLPHCINEIHWVAILWQIHWLHRVWNMFVKKRLFSSYMETKECIAVYIDICPQLNPVQLGIHY